jgi:hypothetical protein
MKSGFKELYLTWKHSLFYDPPYEDTVVDRFVEGNVILLPLKVMGSYSYRSFSKKEKFRLLEPGKSGKQY